MAIKKTYLGQNPDGTPHYHYDAGQGHVVVTGKAYGPVTTSDGTTYDVSEAVIEVASREHAGEVAHLIGVRHEEAGHPDHTDPDVPFVHLCSDSCGSLKREGVTGVDEVTGHPVRLSATGQPMRQIATGTIITSGEDGQS